MLASSHSKLAILWAVISVEIILWWVDVLKSTVWCGQIGELSISVPKMVITELQWMLAIVDTHVICTYVPTHKHTCTPTQTLVHMHTCTHRPMHVCVISSTYLNIHRFIRTGLHIYIYIYNIHTHIHTHTHTHTYVD